MKTKKYTECIAKNSGTGECSTYKNGRFCWKHKAQFKIGIIDKNGKKVRNFLKSGRNGGWGGRYKKYTECIAKNSGTGKCNEKYHGKFCTKHYSQYRYGIIDKNGKKIRNFKRMEKLYVDECIAKNSDSGKCSIYKNGRFCGTHENQYRRGIIDKDGNKIRDLKYIERSYKKECLAKNSGAGECSIYKKGRFCTKHTGQYNIGIIDKDGKKLRLLGSELKCKIKGCNNKLTNINKFGLCKFHSVEIFVKGKLLEYEDSFTPIESTVKPNKKIKWHQI